MHVQKQISGGPPSRKSSSSDICNYLKMIQATQKNLVAGQFGGLLLPASSLEHDTVRTASTSCPQPVSKEKYAFMFLYNLKRSAICLVNKSLVALFFFNGLPSSPRTVSP